MDEQQRAEYAALLEQRRAAHVRAWRYLNSVGRRM